ncbi:phosphatidylserine decarboxylase [Bacillus sp. V33-4]|uniref:phosphatidylserine decarboxylase n=1 Tax=Bacillus sp. V33-4 TaxID=2054169 RepID=UPI000C780BD8|nr:phosphatidylserine decarboxylase [Bacillus sp. V33-4]PLR87674.1 phosphatidylserine decarboxylase [Bacillus sp. V33-4]
MIQNIYRSLIELTNGPVTSGILKRFARSKASRLIVRSFAKVYRLNENEMEKPLTEYPTLHELFIRKLKAGSRVTDPIAASITSPVDAVIEEIGIVNAEHEIEVKGKVYSIREMIGNDKALLTYHGGTYVIFYLSPSHYHRIHSPVSGKITGQWTLGKKSYPVNRLGLKYGKNPLSKNYRTITEVEHGGGHLAIIKVGAMFVNSIEPVHEGNFLTKGKEMAYFTFGSTVVLLFEKGSVTLDPSLKTPVHIKVGERIGIVKDFL